MIELFVAGRVSRITVAVCATVMRTLGALIRRQA
jgi:hypothetical protein